MENDGGMILTGENRRILRKTCPSATLFITNPTWMPSSYRPIILLDTEGKLFQKILFASVLREQTGAVCYVTSSSGSDPDTALRHSWYASLKESIKTLTKRDRPGFPGCDKPFDTVWAEGLLYKLTMLNLQYYLVKIIPSYLHCRTFQISFKITSTRRNMRLVWPTGGVACM
jgi:hypothetical protein